MRRVRWYQSWARYPKDHHALVTAVLGTCKVEEIVGVQRLTSEGNVCLSSTPMATQMADDMTPGRWKRVRFLEFLVEELRGVKMAYCFPESEQEETEEIDGRLMTKTKGKNSVTNDLRTTGS